MALIAEIDSAFEVEIERYITRLERHSNAASTEAHHGDFSDQQLRSLRHLATQMKQNVLLRLGHDCKAWASADGDDREPTFGPLHRAIETENDADLRDAAAHCRELEERLQQKRDELQQLRVEVARDLKEQVGQRVDSAEAHARRMMEMCAWRGPDVGSEDDETFGAEERALVEKFQQKGQYIAEHIESANKFLSELDASVNNLERVEDQQRRGPGEPEEELMDEATQETTEDRRLKEYIAQAEHTCKRMRSIVETLG